VSKKTTHSFHIEKFNFKKLNELEGKKQYRIEISNRFTASENLDREVDINRTWETIRKNIQFQLKSA
jgi:hypothetical protein